MSKRTALVVLIATSALTLTLGCGDTVVEGDGGNGGSGATATGSGTGGSGATGAGGSGAGGTGGATSCEAYHDEIGGSAVTVRFRNDSGLPIYLPAHCGNVQFSITPFGGDDGINYAYDPFCLQTCEDLQSEGIVDCAACEPSSVLLPPGATYDTGWAGTGLLSVSNMPDNCWAMPGSQGGCPQLVVAAAGDYRIDAVGYESCEVGVGDCICDPDGLCYGSATGWEAIADSTVFTHVDEALVEVVFGVCAFPCPSSGS